MGHKTSGTKRSKRVAKVESRQTKYDELIRRQVIDPYGFHRPGGSAVKGHPNKTILKDVSDGLELLRRLGFTAFSESKKLIKLTGSMSLQVLRATDFLVKNGFQYTTIDL